MRPEVGRKMCATDFEILLVLGEGSYAKVHRVRDRATGAIYAMKEIDKTKMKKVIPIA